MAQTDWATLGTALSPLLVAELLALGMFTGFAAGLLGIGGGMIVVPFVAFIVARHGVEPGMAVKMGIATAMATIMLTSISSVRAHHRMHAVRWDVVRPMAPGIVAGGLLAGAGLFSALRGQWLALLFAGFAVASAMQMIRDRKPLPSRTLPGGPQLAAVGACIGFASGLVGAGGAFLTVPFLIWCNVALRHAVGTSAALGFPIAVASTAGYVVGGWQLQQPLPGAWGYLYLPAWLIISTASVMCAPLGARLAHDLPVWRLRQAFALLLVALASYMVFKSMAWV